MSDEAINDDPDFDDLTGQLAEAARHIEVPKERIEAGRAAFLAAIDSAGTPRRSGLRRALALIAATLALSMLAGTAYASSNAEPGSALWNLRTKGWDLRAAFSSGEEQASAFARQAEEAAALADKAASRCDSRGVEVARKEAISRLERVREKVEKQTEGTPSRAGEVLARVETKLAQLPPPGGPACDDRGVRMSGPAASQPTGPQPGLPKGRGPGAGEGPGERAGEGPGERAGDGPGGPPPGSGPPEGAGKPGDGRPHPDDLPPGQAKNP